MTVKNLYNSVVHYHLYFLLVFFSTHSSKQAIIIIVPLITNNVRSWLEDISGGTDTTAGSGFSSQEIHKCIHQNYKHDENLSPMVRLANLYAPLCLLS